MIHRVLLISLLIVASGCVPQGQPSKPLSPMKTEIDRLRELQIENNADLSALADEMRQLTGRVEELEFALLNRNGGNFPPPNAENPGAQIENNVTMPNAAAFPPPIVPREALELDEQQLGTLPADLAQAYGDGLTKLREGQYPDAIALLRNAAEASLGQDWRANVLFWLGVSYDGLGDNRRALAAYNEVVSKYPKHPRTALALFREASVFIRLGDSRTAKVTYQKLLSDFPKSPEAIVAKERIKDLA